MLVEQKPETVNSRPPIPNYTKWTVAIGVLTTLGTALAVGLRWNQLNSWQRGILIGSSGASAIASSALFLKSSAPKKKEPHQEFIDKIKPFLLENPNQRLNIWYLPHPLYIDLKGSEIVVTSQEDEQEIARFSEKEPGSFEEISQIQKVVDLIPFFDDPENHREISDRLLTNARSILESGKAPSHRWISRDNKLYSQDIVGKTDFLAFWGFFSSVVLADFNGEQLQVNFDIAAEHTVTLPVKGSPFIFVYKQARMRLTKDSWQPAGGEEERFCHQYLRVAMRVLVALYFEKMVTD